MTHQLLSFSNAPSPPASTANGRPASGLPIQIIYKGQTEVREEDEEGNRIAVTTDRFLIRKAGEGRAIIGDAEVVQVLAEQQAFVESLLRDGVIDAGRRLMTAYQSDEEDRSLRHERCT